MQNAFGRCSPGCGAVRGASALRTLLATTAAQCWGISISPWQRQSNWLPHSPDEIGTVLLCSARSSSTRGQLDQAIAAFQQAESKAAGNPGPGAYLANALEQAGRFDEGLRMLPAGI